MRLRSGAPGEAGMAVDRIEHIKRLCGAWVDQGVHKALCVLVARRGVVCLHEAFGQLGPGEAPALQGDSIFPVLSISKPITATVLMQLVEDGRAGLSRPVQEYVPEFRGARKELVCVHHLLTHTSGIGGGGTATEDDDAAGTTDDPEVGEWVRQIARMPLRYEPGTEMRYTGANYVLIGEIIRRVTGRTHDELANERIFGPLGMADSSYALPPERADRAIGWNAMPGLLDTTSTEFRAEPTPNTGVQSTALDLAVLGQTFLNGGTYGDCVVLHPATVAEMTRDQIPGVGANFSIGAYERHFAEASWGYGWSIAGNERWPRWPMFPRGTFSHSGGGGALLWIDPVNEIVGVYLSICRFSRETYDPLSNNDLFVNAIVAATTDH
jgi:CubicO group peptidase (beta-lactamase class C family)